MMQVSKKIPFDNPDVLLGVRTMYIASNIAIAALYYYIYTVIVQKKGTPNQSPVQAMFNRRPLTQKIQT